MLDKQGYFWFSKSTHLSNQMQTFSIWEMFVPEQGQLFQSIRA